MGGYLRFAGEEYLARIATGAFFVEMSMVARLAGTMLLIIMAFASSGGAGVARGVAVVTALAALSMSTFGWWQITSEHTLVAQIGARRWARWTMVVGNGLEMMAFASMGGVSPSPTALASMVLPGAPCISLVFVLVWLLSLGFQSIYLSDLMRRIPNASLATTATVGAWLNPALVVGSIPMGLLCFPVAPLAWVAAFVFYFVVVDRCRAALATVRDEARVIRARTGEA
jgi:hypothetical protein